MADRRSDSYDGSGIDPEKFHHLRHGASIDSVRHAAVTSSARTDENVTALPASFPASIPYDSVKSKTYSAPTPPSTSQSATRRPLINRIRTEYVLLSKKKKIGILVGIVALIVLIIGLAAGLSTRSQHSQNLPLPSNHGGPYTGDLTYYEPALGSCGITSTSSDSIVAVSHLLYDAVSTGSNPNANPLCGKKIRARRNNKSVDLTVVDRCTGCKATDLDVTESVFADLADISQGRVTVEWAWLEDVPGGDIPSSSPPSSVVPTTTSVTNTTVPGSSTTSVTTTPASPSSTILTTTTSTVPTFTTTTTTPTPESSTPSSTASTSVTNTAAAAATTTTNSSAASGTLSTGAPASATGNSAGTITSSPAAATTTA